MVPRRRRDRDRDKHPHGTAPGSNSGFYLLSGGGAYYLPSGDDSAGYVDDNGAADQTDNSAQNDQQPADSGVQPAEQSGQPSDQFAANESDESEPVRDEGEFSLVMRDGSSVEAIAFTHSNGKIVYITTEGLRRSFADSQLDQAETVRVNLERGTPLQLPL